jgi:hypothetical protein
MGAVDKISRAYQRDKEMRVLHEPHKKNQFTLMPFRVFLSKRNKLGFGKKTRLAKAVSEEIDGSFDDQAIVDAIYCYMASNADAGEKQIVADEITAKVIAMSQSADVILLAASINSD